MNYYKLEDPKNRDTVVKADGYMQYEYENGTWVRSGILLHYQTEGSPFYDLYTEISESEAMQIVKQSTSNSKVST